VTGIGSTKLLDGVHHFTATQTAQSQTVSYTDNYGSARTETANVD